MLLEKRALSVEEIEAQTALELPDREMMALLNVVVFDVVDVRNVNVTAQVGANICNVNAAVLAVDTTQTSSGNCEVTNTATSRAGGPS